MKTSTVAVTTSTQAARSGDTNVAQAMDLARAKLERWVKGGASDSGNGWALAHGLVGFGRDLQASDGRLAIEVIASYARVVPIDGKPRIDFPPRSPNGQVLEAHETLMVKSMLEAGVPAARAFEVPGAGKVTLQRTIDDAEAVIQTPKTDQEWHDFAWSLSALLIAHKDLERKKGKPSELEVKLTTYALQTLAYLETQQAFLEPLFASDRADQVQKRKQGIFSHTCGGMHLIQAANAGAAFAGTKDAIDRARHQLDLLLFRYKAERRIYAETIAKAPEYALLIRAQELKFYGHLLETFAFAAKLGIVTPDDALRAKLRPVAADLVRVVGQLEPAYGNLANIRKDREQTYLDLIGDGCHAIRGLREGVVALFGP